MSEPIQFTISKDWRIIGQDSFPVDGNYVLVMLYGGDILTAFRESGIWKKLDGCSIVQKVIAWKPKVVE